MLEVAARGCIAEFFVNDIPVVRIAPGVAPQDAVPIPHMLIDQENTLGVIIHPGPRPSAALAGIGAVSRSTADTVNVSAVIKTYPQGVFPGDPSGVQLAEIRWSAKSEAQDPYATPVLRVARFRADGPVPAWSWQSAPKLTIDPALEREVMEICKAVHAGLSAGDPGPLFRAAAPRYAEVASAFDMQAEKLMESFRATLAKERARPKWAMAPMNPASLDLRLAGDQRLVDAIAVDFRPIVRALPQVNGFPGMELPMRLARLGGALMVVR